MSESGMKRSREENAPAAERPAKRPAPEPSKASTRRALRGALSRYARIGQSALACVQRGQVLCKVATIKPVTKFSASIYALTKEEGGRHKPFFSNYSPQFFFRTANVTGSVTLAADKQMVMPGDNATLNIELISPVAITEGLRFALREGGKTVGAGVVSKIVS